MTAEIVNLRRARKAKARDTRQAEAAENRVRFGRTKAERDVTKRERARDRSRHEGHKLGGDGDAE
jgi:hypothetical protein